MISSRLMFCAKDIIHDVNKNSITAYSLIEDSVGVSFPIFFPSINLIVILDREESDDNEIDCTLNISHNKSSVIDSQKFRVNFQGQLRTRSIHVINGFTIPSPGTMRFEILHNGKVINAYVIKATLINTEDATPKIDTNST